MAIQWYPGHMAKSVRLMTEQIALVDVVVELLDARIPYSSQNPDISKMAKNKRRLIVLNKSDLADDAVTDEWIAYFKSQGLTAIKSDSAAGKGMDRIAAAVTELCRDKIESQKSKGRISVPIRSMITGIPNVGKSTLINKYAGKSIAKTGDRPGVTRSKQWIRIRKDFDLLDTPGILWPRFDDQRTGVMLSITGAINDNILDLRDLSIQAIETITKIKPDAIGIRYKIAISGQSSDEVLEMIARARGFIKKGNEVDIDRAAIIFLDELRGGKLGRITFERPGERQ